MVYVVLLVVSAFITPDASPVTMALLFAAMLALYEISLLAARLVLGKRVKEQQKELEEEAKADAEWEKEWAERQLKRKREREAEEA